jgi:hypothetical protein
MDPTKEQHQILYKSRKKCDRDPGIDYTSVRGRKHKTYMESPNLPRQVKSKVKSMLIIFLDIKGIVHKEFVLAGQTVISAHYCGVWTQLHVYCISKKVKVKLSP